MSSSTATDAQLEKSRAGLIESALAAGALKFGSFTLKSGRISPYFFNSGLLIDGAVLSDAGSAYASLIVSKILPTVGPFDVLFGPAYKGISLGALTTSALYTQHSINVSFAYNRKEAKDHGEGGVHVGAPLKGKKVLILDDVFTAGTAIREAAQGIVAAGGTIVGVVLILDREEVGKEGETESAKIALQKELGAQVYAVLGVTDIITWLEKSGKTEEVALMKEYRERYGIKGQ